MISRPVAEEKKSLLDRMFTGPRRSFWFFLMSCYLYICSVRDLYGGQSE